MLVGVTGIVIGALVWVLASLALGADGEELQAGLVPALLGVLAGVAVAAAARSHVAELRRHLADARRELHEGEERLGFERRAKAALDRARRAERAWAAELRGSTGTATSGCSARARSPSSTT